MRKRSIKAIDFFCGGGGMSLGMRQAGIDVIAGIDNDPVCRETYEANHPDSLFMNADITTCDVNHLGKELDIDKHDDDMIFIGCSPCQYWSVINGQSNSKRKQKSRDSRNLLHDFLRFVKYYRPGFVVVENVRGIKRDPKESGLERVLKFFDNSGYYCWHDVVSVNQFGVPQTRSRFILTASRVIDIAPLKPGKTKPTVSDYIGDKKRLLKIAAGECDPRDNLHRSPGLSETNISRLKLTPTGGLRNHWHHRDDLQIDAYRGKSTKFFRENYGRMAWDKPAPTITTKFFALGSGRFGHPEENRAISLREGAILQTFPKSYQFKTAGFINTGKLIGNAVPPKFAKCIGRAIIKQWRMSSTRKLDRG